MFFVLFIYTAYINHLLNTILVSHHGKSHIFLNGLFLPWEALLQFVYIAFPSTVDGVYAPIFWWTQDHFIIGVIQRLPLQLPIGQLVYHTAKLPVILQFPNIVDT